jgi:hypothetical protein
VLQRNWMQSSSLAGGKAERGCAPSAQPNAAARQSATCVAPAENVPVPVGQAVHVSLLTAPTAEL